MADSDKVKYYSPAEEWINIMSHALGLLLSIIALPLLVLHAIRNGNGWHLVAFAVFGLSMIGLYASSTFYHLSKDPALRARMRIVDHASIYLLIAGTYTPFTLITLGGINGWVVFAVSWSMALTGIVLKIFFTGRFQLLSTLMYVFMGWIIIFVMKPLVTNLPLEGVYWLIAGGIAYTVGAILYSIRKIHFNHAIFHVFVLIGSFCHFMAVYFWVLPHPN
jgi:hemolysin III